MFGEDFEKNRLKGMELSTEGYASNTEEPHPSPASSSTNLISNKKNYRNELLTSSGVILSGIISGYSIGFTTSAIADLEKENRLTTSEANWFAALLHVGAILGCLLAAVISDYLGRKLSMMISANLAAVGWWLTLADWHVSFLFIGRVMCGMQFGLLSTVAASYLVETMSEHLRGIFMSATGLSVSMGMLFCYFFRLLLNWQWQIVAALCFTVIYAFVMAFLPESPRWLMKYGRVEEANESLNWLRMGDHATVHLELVAMEKSGSFNQGNKVKIKEILLEQKYRNPLLLTTLLAFDFFLSCHAAFLAFTWQILQDNGINEDSVTTFGLGFLQIIVGIVITIIANVAERRTFLTIGGATVSVSLLLLSIYDILQGASLINNNMRWLSVAFLVMYFIGFNVGLNAFAYTAINEILPTEIRGHVVGIASAVSYIGNAISSATFRPLESVVGQWGAFLIYAVLNTLVTIVVALRLPDTKTKSLEEIELNLTK